MTRLPDTKDTIAAQSTPQGSGALAVVRLSGPDAFKVASAFLGQAAARPRHAEARLMPVTDGQRLLDRAVVVFFKGPASYTGDDTVEISCHGSPHIIRTLLNLCVRNGARPAGPGEFTLRAFLNGKLDLARAEAVAALIESSSAGAHRAALAQAEGALSRELETARRELVGLLAELEVRLDDSYEEIEPLALARFARRAAAARARLQALADGYEAGRGVREGLRVVITGAPNSGKSSLLNALLGYDRALVSRSAGTTRDTLEGELEVDGFKVIFTDTAGLNARPASQLERRGMRRAAAEIARAGAVVLVADGSIKETPSDRRAETEASALPAGARLIKVLNKCDLPARRPAAGRLRVSARTGAGLAALKTALVAEEKKAFSEGAQAVVTSARHFAALSGAAEELRGMEALLKDREPRLELAAERLRAALARIGEVTGETAPEEVLAGIFGTFCVGK